MPPYAGNNNSNNNNANNLGYGGFTPFPNSYGLSNQHQPSHGNPHHLGHNASMHLNGGSHMHQVGGLQQQQGNMFGPNMGAGGPQMPPAGVHREDSNVGRSASAAPPTNPSRIKELEYVAISRAGSAPHHHARAAQLQKRGHAALTIIDPKDTVSPAAPSYGSYRGKKATKGPDEEGDANLRTVAKPSRIAQAEAEKESLEAIDQTWTTLDMGGMHLKALSPPLFGYTFLTALYLPHNNLTELPVELCRLNALIRLDVSSNKLTLIQPEFGMLTSLREFFLFDNQLTVLPPELGTLYMLDMLGVEGNPLQESLKSIAEKDGTAGLVSFLRDSCPVPMPPPEREWILIEQEEGDEVPTADNGEENRPQDGFSVLCYNILCEKMATPQMYGYTPSWALSWEYRKELILQEISGYAADILCLQEVDMEQYEEYFSHNLGQQDYEGVYWPRSRARTMSEEEKRHVDGEAIFYKSTTWVFLGWVSFIPKLDSHSCL